MRCPGSSWTTFSRGLIGALALSSCQLLSDSGSLAFEEFFPSGGSAPIGGSAGTGGEGGGFPSACTAGTVEECVYSGQPSTKNVGVCTTPTRTCDEQGGWSNCEGETLPSKHETCSDGLDNDCDDQIDEGCIAAGQYHACVVTVEGDVKCWGNNNAGQIGDNSSANTRPSAVTVLDVTGAMALAAGTNHTCALLAGGTVKCWGNNSLKQVNGDMPFATILTAVDLAPISDASVISSRRYTTCFISAGTVACWGDRGAWPPSPMPGIASATSLGLANSHACSAGPTAVQCWGANSAGELGTGTPGDATTIPTAVSGLSGASAIVGGTSHTCAIGMDGNIFCWGNPSDGRLGTGPTAANTHATPTKVVGTISARAVALGLGASHTCAVFEDGSAKCWGQGNVLGIPSVPTTDAPTDSVVGLTDAVAVSAGEYFTCALRSNGQVRCWGNNLYGQLGNNAGTDSPSPVDVIGL